MQLFLFEITNPQEQICSYPMKTQFLQECVVKGSYNWEDNEIISFFPSPYKRSSCKWYKLTCKGFEKF